jgi:hypothetical protein
MDLDDFGTDLEQDDEDSQVTLKIKNVRRPQAIDEDHVDAENRESNETYRYTQWSEIKKGNFIATGKAKKSLPPGLYNIRQLSDGTILFNLMEIETDQYISLVDSLSERILNEITKFWTIRQKFEKFGFIHSRGYLLYGKPGSGKSILVKQIISGVVKGGGIAFYYDCSPGTMSTALKLYRSIEKDRPIVTVLEDIDALIERYGESEILAFLDGETKVNNVLNIATTNYPERLDRRIIARPRRFDRVEKIDTPNADMRREFFKIKANIVDETELNLWVNETKDFSFAALSDLIISIKCFGYEFSDAISKLKKLLNAKPSSEEFNSKPGFGSRD